MLSGLWSPFVNSSYSYLLHWKAALINKTVKVLRCPECLLTKPMEAEREIARWVTHFSKEQEYPDLNQPAEVHSARGGPWLLTWACLWKQRAGDSLQQTPSSKVFFSQLQASLSCDSLMMLLSCCRLQGTSRAQAGWSASCGFIHYCLLPRTIFYLS